MRRILLFLSLILVLAACNQKIEAPPTPATIIPYQTATSTLTPTFLPGPTKAFIPPTPTVFTYTVIQGDTLSGIAQRNGITLEALLAANPGISPTALSVGTKLIIPPGDQATDEPAPTPAALPPPQAHCWPETTGGLWCLALLQNDYAETLENISVQFTLVDSSGQERSNQMAYGLLDILPAGESMPLAVHFAPPVPDFEGVQVQVVTAIRLLPGDTRYLPVRLENTLVTVDASGLTAQVSGDVVLDSDVSASTLWVLASAYDQAGNAVGVRRWEAGTPLTGKNPIPFDFQVSSLGPGIARVEFLAEAQP
jgi:LysM repeat protein